MTETASALLLAPLREDMRALAHLIERSGAPVRTVANGPELGELLEGDDFSMVVVTEEAASEDVGNVLGRFSEREPPWSMLPAVFLIEDATYPPPACRALARNAGELRSLMLERPLAPAVLRGVFAAQIQFRLRQFQTRALLTQIREAEHRQTFLLRELRHRTRNSFAVLRGMFSMTARRHTCLDEFVSAFSKRLDAMVKAYAALSESDDFEAGLEEVVRVQVEPYSAAPDRIVTAGPRARLTARAALSIGIAINELATNAAKYGAFSVPRGSVRIEWAPDPSDRGLRLSWTETGGPKVARPQREGLGATVIRTSGADLSGESADTLRYCETGVRWNTLIPEEACRIV